jgi:hypothetical protein
MREEFRVERTKAILFGQQQLQLRVPTRPMCKAPDRRRRTSNTYDFSSAVSQISLTSSSVYFARQKSLTKSPVPKKKNWWMNALKVDSSLDAREHRVRVSDALE